MTARNITSKFQDYKDFYLQDSLNGKLLSNRFSVYPIDKSESKKTEPSFYDKAFRVAKIATTVIAGAVLCIAAYTILFGDGATTPPSDSHQKNSPDTPLEMPVSSLLSTTLQEPVNTLSINNPNLDQYFDSGPSSSDISKIRS